MTDFERLVDEYGAMCRILGRFDEHPAGFDKAKATFRLARKRAALLAALPKGEPVVKRALVSPSGEPLTLYHNTCSDDYVQRRADKAGDGYRIARFELREVAGDE